MTKDETIRKLSAAEISRVMADMGRLGGIARRKAISPQRASEIAKKASKAGVAARRRKAKANKNRK